MHKKTFTSLLWHNTNARYNGYYLSKEKIREAENTIFHAKKDNFNRVLRVYTPLEKSTVGSIKPVLEEAYKKASLPIQYHKNSKWVDNCYILIGKTNFYQKEFEKAIIAFKYVNTISEDDQDKAEALIWLARSFSATDQMEFAMGVINHIKKIDLNKENKELLALSECELYQKLDYDSPFAENIKIAAENATTKRNRSRSNFIAGQIFQKLEQNDDAYYHYKKCLRTNPEYELEFYCKLNMAQVANLENQGGVKKIRKYFKKLLRDIKNIDYKDKIYYEMAKFEMKQNKTEQAIVYLNESVQNSTSNVNQKAYSYLMLGEIYYEKLQFYRKSAAYYDSTMMFLTKDEPDYLAIKKRTKILQEFVTQLAIIEMEDSLQTMARMDSSQLVDLIDFNIKKEEERKRRLEELKNEREKKKEEDKAIDNSGLLNGPNAWYFYNPTMIAKGRAEFNSKWGERKLEDNWRRVNKEEFFTEEDEDPEDIDSSASAQNNSKDNNLSTEDKEAKEAARLLKLRNEVLKNIPFTPAALAASNKKIEDALSKLGSIYHLKLEELERASETYETLLKRFPEHKKKIEVYYILFIINKDINKTKSDYYKNLILTNYPESLFAKLVLDPDYLTKNWQLNKQAELMYDKAYKMYEGGQYHESVETCDEIETKYPENYIHDKIALLRILNTSKIKGLIIYKQQLNDYIKKYKSSKLKATAQAYLKECEAFIEREVNGGVKVSDSAQVQIYDEYVDDKQYFIFFVPKNKGISLNDVKVNIGEFNNLYKFPGKELKGPVPFNADLDIYFVRTFANRQDGLKYLQKIDMPKIVENDKVEIEAYCITIKNFIKLRNTKALKEYSTFFKNNYF